MPDIDSHSDQMAATVGLNSGSCESFVDTSFHGDNESIQESSHRRKILIDTMQLVEPRNSLPVPNHILDTKLYCKVAENGLIRVNPVVVHFAGFEPNRRSVQKLDLQNMSTDIQQMHIIPPQTKYFNIKYTKKPRLAPGFSLSCTIEFYPDEWRYFYDCVRVHCKGEKNLIVPIHAYPVMNTSEFPQLIDFPAVPLGEVKTKVFPLRCHAPVDFEFQLTILTPSPAFTVKPMAGIVPGNGEVDIRVSFHPTSFSSSTMKLQLEISQFLAFPLVCIVTGRCLPGMKRDNLLAKSHSVTFDTLLSPLKTLDPMMISPVERAHSRKLKSKTPRLLSAGAMLESEPQVIERDGIRIPLNLDNPHSVGVVLNQKAGKLKIKDLRSTLLGSPVQTTALTRQMKEAMFDMAVRKGTFEERQNQLRWQVKLGEEAVSAGFHATVLAGREEAEQIYKRHRGELDEKEECAQTFARLTWRRTRRQASLIVQPVATFDAFRNDLWLCRHAAIDRFRQAARKVIIQLRMKPRLAALKRWLETRTDKKSEDECAFVSDEKNTKDELEAHHLKISNINSVTFPVHVTPSVQNKLHSGSPGIVTLKPTEIRLQEKVPYFALKVPQQYKLLGYRPFNAQDTSASYIPTHLVRPLRTGAEDELINLDLPVTIGNAEISKVARGSNAIQKSTSDVGTEVAPLVPPKAMFQPIKYPALHIFNPVPGLLTFQNHLPYSETDPDFHLCTLPRFISTNSSNPHMATQKQYLTRQEIIKGVMTWKKFASSSVVSLTGTPTLSNVWIPRWNDPFSQELIPFDVPPLLDSVSEDDKQIISEQTETSEEHEIQLTPQMVRAEFAAFDENCRTDDDVKGMKSSEIPTISVPEVDKLPVNNLPCGENGPIMRDQREANLDQYLKKKLGLLGQRIHSRISYIDSLKKKKSALVPE